LKSSFTLLELLISITLIVILYVALLNIQNNSSLILKQDEHNFKNLVSLISLEHDRKILFLDEYKFIDNELSEFYKDIKIEIKHDKLKTLHTNELINMEEINININNNAQYRINRISLR
jgi:competence protein ComGC